MRLRNTSTAKENLDPGSYTVEATPYAKSDCEGEAGTTLSSSLTVTPCSVTDFVLWFQDGDRRAEKYRYNNRVSPDEFGDGFVVCYEDFGSSIQTKANACASTMDFEL
jgi:hypothetical protein